MDNNIQDLYGLTKLQEGILFNSIFSPKSNAYIVQNVFEITGDLEIDIFKKSWEMSVSKYDILRSVFLWKEASESLQCVLKKVNLTYNFIDLTGNDNKANKLQELINNDKTQHYDLSYPPLFRITIVKFSESSHYFIWNYHHILIDGWSAAIIYNDVLKIYQALKSGKFFQSKENVSYKNYIIWLQQQDNKAAASFWSKYLSDLEELTLLNSKKITSLADIKEENYLYYRFSLTTQQTNDLETIARKNSTTLSTAIQSLWGLLIALYKNSSDVIFGVTLSGRNIDLEGIE